MKPEEDPWLKSAHANAELLDREVRALAALTGPIREQRPVITKYQDFWNRAKAITAKFRELKPLAKSDRDLLWKRFNDLCREVKERQKAEYGTLEALSQQHLDQVMQLAGRAELPPGSTAPGIHDLVERGKALKNAGDLLGRFKHAMIAKHKKIGFDRIQEIRKSHDAAWLSAKTRVLEEQPEAESRIRKNLAINRERHRKALGALENFQISRGHIRTFLASCENPGKAKTASIQLAETEARIRDIEEGIRKLEKWIAEDERLLAGDAGTRLS